MNKGLSFFVAFASLAGSTVGPLNAVLHFAFPLHPLVFFGCYCLLIGYLIFRAAFLPRVRDALMAFAGLGWLTFLSTALANHLVP